MADATEVSMSKHNPLAQTVYQLQGGNVHPNFEKKNKIFRKKIFSLYYDQKNTLHPLVKSVFKSIHNYGDICNFVTAVSALSNTSQRSVYN